MNKTIQKVKDFLRSSLIPAVKADQSREALARSARSHAHALERVPLAQPERNLQSCSGSGSSPLFLPLLSLATVPLQTPSSFLRPPLSDPTFSCRPQYERSPIGIRVHFFHEVFGGRCSRTGDTLGRTFIVQVFALLVQQPALQLRDQQFSPGEVEVDGDDKSDT